jgi:hypothetical protein
MDNTLIPDERVQWTSGLHVHTASLHAPVTAGHAFNPSHPRLRGVVHWFVGIQSLRRLPLKGHGSD